MGKKKLKSTAVMVMLVLTALSISCNKEENTLIFNKAKLAAVTNLRAFSYDANSVGLSWTKSTDAGESQFADLRITVKDGSIEYLTRVVSKTFSDSALIIGSLNENTAYTFEIMSRAISGSQDFTDGDPVSIRWAPARRLNGGMAVKVYEIAALDSSGLQFFDGIGSHVFPNSPTYQSLLDVIVDSTASTGIVILKSAHLNPFGGQRRTRFSSFDTLVNHLDVGRIAPPDPASYTRDSIFIGPEILTAGRMFYALTQGSNYVRILFERNPVNSTLLFGTKPRRYVSIKLSYQYTGGIIYSRPRKQPNTVAH